MARADEALVIASIQNCDAAIQMYERKIYDLKNQIEQLHELQKRYIEVRERFMAIQESSSAALGREGVADSTLKVVQAYKEGMTKLLHGSLLSRAEDDFSNGLAVIQCKIRGMEEEIAGYLRQIRQYQYEIAEARRALSAVRGEA